MEELVRLCAQPIGFLGTCLLVVGVIYLGITLKDGFGGGGQLYTAVAMVAAGTLVVAFAALYGFTPF